MSTLKALKIFIIGIFFSLSLSSCSSEGPIIHGYTSPIVTGQVLDKTTNKPIENVSISQTSRDEATTDSNGYFKLPAYKVSYTASDDGWGMQLMSEGGFYLYKEGYRRKRFWNSGLKFLEIKYTSEVPYHIHLGKVYLEPLPEGMSANDVEDDIVEKMMFCQLNESQKEVDCMPLPDGVTHEAL